MNTKSSEISTLSTLVILDRCLCNSLNHYQSPLSHQMKKKHGNFNKAAIFSTMLLHLRVISSSRSS